MPSLLAICDTCLTVWVPNAVGLEGARGVVIENFSVGPCPTCGGTGHIPDGIYSATTDTISVIATSVKSAQALATLHRILQRAHKEQASAERLAALLEDEGSADFSPVAAVVRREANNIDIKYWIAIALAVVGILEAHATDQKVDDLKATVDQIYSQVVTQHPAPTPAVVAPQPTASSIPKVGRNDPCPCGSGKEYKRCHGG